MSKVSVIIPVYNVEKYIKQCLDSAINQTLKDIEIICVDDCSTDNSLHILKGYASNDSRIKIIKFNRNKGAGEARNAALDMAQGEYIMFLDGDDWLEPEACEFAYNRISSNDNDFVIFAHNRFYEDDNSSKFINKMIKKFSEEEKKLYLKDVNTKFIKCCYIWALIYKRELLTNNNIKFPKYRVFEDQPFYIKTMLCADNFSIINKALYNHRRRNDSITYIYKKQHQDFYNAKKDILKILKTVSAPKKLRMAIYSHTIDSSFTWYNRYLGLNPNIQKKFCKNISNIFMLLNQETVYKLKKNNNLSFYQEILETNWKYRIKQKYKFLQKNILNFEGERT